MQVYNYWSRATFHTRSPSGYPVQFTAYAGSDESAAAARTRAEGLARERAALILANEWGNYPTGTRPLREHLVRRLPDGRGGTLAAITRNRYGSLILNTPGFMMLDVDDQDLQPPPPPIILFEGLRRFFRRLFNQPSPPPLLPPDPTPRGQLQLRLAVWLQLHPTWNFRLYRTRLGFRLLVTHQLLEPNTDTATEVFKALRTDTTFVRLCQQQHCYRARLNPKPWRIGYHRPPHQFPFDTPEQEQQQQAWQQEYTRRSQQYSVCEWLGEFGSGTVLPELKPLIQLHDDACLGGRKLA
ncbi:hypothetical protein KLP40_12200 [Hymenobacter sp. NST-14]|uniref:hypothetical protein n=1 Tax=Hymenobacter piscis TaxID=2839984 RepID=UPI001C016814|nr:hypothetical protein [Hymenobacter piscis]MBT9393926.1 hypothetical protein [Hymenobacter piscis]